MPSVLVLLYPGGSWVQDWISMSSWLHVGWSKGEGYDWLVFRSVVCGVDVGPGLGIVES